MEMQGMANGEELGFVAGMVMASGGGGDTGELTLLSWRERREGKLIMQCFLAIRGLFAHVILA